MAFFQMKSGIFGGIYFFRVVFLVGSNYINPENNYGCLIDFLGQISKLSYCDLLDLADFVMHRTSFRFRFLCCSRTPVLATCADSELRHKLLAV